MGNTNSMQFEYNDFLLIANVQGKQEIAQQQQILQQYYCTIAHHHAKSIEGICLNEICRQQNRRTCFDCINDRIHDNDNGKLSLIRNADQVELIIEKLKKALNNQIDTCQVKLTRNTAESQRADLAFKTYDAALQLNPKDAVCLNNKGLTLNQIQNFEQAIVMFDQTIDLQPMDAVYYNNGGMLILIPNQVWLQSQYNNFKQAIIMYDSAIELSPEEVVYYNNKGNAHLINNQKDQ